LDGLACAVAYAEFLQSTGRQALAGIMGLPQDEAVYVMKRFNISGPQQIKNADGFEEVILVDTSDLSGVEGNVRPDKVIEVIDHRSFHEAEKFPNAHIQIEKVGAAATLITEKFMQGNNHISRSAAILLAAAIISNSLNFKSSMTTDRDRQAAKWLEPHAGLPEIFWKELFVAKSDLSGSRLTERIRGDIAAFTVGGKKLSIAQMEIIGVRKLLAERQTEIVPLLEEIQHEHQLDFFFLNCIDLEAMTNDFMAGDIKTQRLLEKVLGVKFESNRAHSSSLILRKQLMPLLAKALQGNEKTRTDRPLP
jgi:manganese-dependent inorganic pyrophosphatase